MSVHPLGVIIAIGVGVIVAGIPGALVAVPLAATVNAVAQHLAANTRPGDDPSEELEKDYGAEGERPPDDSPVQTDEALHPSPRTATRPTATGATTEPARGNP